MDPQVPKSAHGFHHLAVQEIFQRWDVHGTGVITRKRLTELLTAVAGKSVTAARRRGPPREGWSVAILDEFQGGLSHTDLD